MPTSSKYPKFKLKEEDFDLTITYPNLTHTSPTLTPLARHMTRTIANETDRLNEAFLMQSRIPHELTSQNTTIPREPMEIETFDTEAVTGSSSIAGRLVAQWCRAHDNVNIEDNPIASHYQNDTNWMFKELRERAAKKEFNNSSYHYDVEDVLFFIDPGWHMDNFGLPDSVTELKNYLTLKAKIPAKLISSTDNSVYRTGISFIDPNAYMSFYLIFDQLATLVKLIIGKDLKVVAGINQNSLDNVPIYNFKWKGDVLTPEERSHFYKQIDRLSIEQIRTIYDSVKHHNIANLHEMFSSRGSAFGIEGSYDGGCILNDRMIQWYEDDLKTDIDIFKLRRLTELLPDFSFIKDVSVLSTYWEQLSSRFGKHITKFLMKEILHSAEEIKMVTDRIDFKSISKLFQGNEDYFEIRGRYSYPWTNLDFWLSFVNVKNPSHFQKNKDYYKSLTSLDTRGIIGYYIAYTSARNWYDGSTSFDFYGRKLELHHHLVVESLMPKGLSNDFPREIKLMDLFFSSKLKDREKAMEVYIQRYSDDLSSKNLNDQYPSVNGVFKYTQDMEDIIEIKDGVDLLHWSRIFHNCSFGRHNRLKSSDSAMFIYTGFDKPVMVEITKLSSYDSIGNDFDDDGLGSSHPFIDSNGWTISEVKFPFNVSLDYEQKFIIELCVTNIERRYSLGEGGKPSKNRVYFNTTPIFITIPFKPIPFKDF